MTTFGFGLAHLVIRNVSMMPAFGCFDRRRTAMGGVEFGLLQYKTADGTIKFQYYIDNY